MLFAVGVAIGAFNGFLIVRLGLNAFIATLAMLILLRGITIGITNGRTLYDLPSRSSISATRDWLGLPAAVWVSAALYPRRQPDPRATTASAARSTRSAATPRRRAPPASAVERYVWTVFVIAGGLAALAGLMLTGRMASVMSGQGQNMIFTVFAACVIGGISLNGGKGTLLGALCGVILLGIISNILTLVQHRVLLDLGDLRRDHPPLADPHPADLRQVLPERLSHALPAVPWRRRLWFAVLQNRFTLSSGAPKMSAMFHSIERKCALARMSSCLQMQAYRKSISMSCYLRDALFPPRIC